MNLSRFSSSPMISILVSLLSPSPAAAPRVTVGTVSGSMSMRAQPTASTATASVLARSRRVPMGLVRAKEPTLPMVLAVASIIFSVGLTILFSSTMAWFRSLC
ncbi:MAG: hypothetical protein AMJ70_04125 [Dehalococcoidia bacterium SG8_51_3]|nr:MAG: hypothetical protein AMJ70_04125 [Dehalococcoidia bacterium SG8_51_3]